MRESAKEMVVDGNLVLVFKEIMNKYLPSSELATIDETSKLSRRECSNDNAKVRQLNKHNDDNNVQLEFDKQPKGNGEI